MFDPKRLVWNRVKNDPVQTFLGVGFLLIVVSTGEIEVCTYSSGIRLLLSALWHARRK
jgi:hypothetical protein